MRYSTMLVAAFVLAAPAASQARRPPPRAFPLAVTGSLVLNSYGQRAEELDGTLPECTSATNCIDHGLGRGPGGGLAIQVPLFGNLGLDLGVDALSTFRRRCLPNGQCVTSDRLFGLRARGELLVRFKARAPVFFGVGAAALRTDPGATQLQTEPTTSVGGVFTIGADIAAGSRTTVRVAWHSFFLKTDDAGLPASYTTRTAHDAAISIGARYAIVP